MTDGSQIREQISDRSDEIRNYGFRYLRTPLPVRDMHGRFAVTGDGSGPTAVTLETGVEPADPAAKDQLTGMIEAGFGQALASLRRWIEQQQRWDTA
jgi:hypothetical protein